SLSFNWTTGGPAEAKNAAGTALTDNFSVRRSGEITFPSTGTYTVRVCSDDTSKVYIDDALIASATVGSGSCTVDGPSRAPPKRIRIDYAEVTGNASLSVTWSGPGITGSPAIPTSALKPRYGLVTSTTTDNDNATNAPAITTTTDYS